MQGFTCRNIPCISDAVVEILRLGTLDGILLERPGIASEFMAHPLPGQILDDPSRIITLFPDTLIATRYSTLIIERQMPVSPGETVFETRHVFLKSDTPQLKELRDQHWMLYWAPDAGNLRICPCSEWR